MNKKVTMCIAWIGGSLLLGFLLWFFTITYRTRLLTDAVNKALAENAGAASGLRIETPSGFFGNPSSVLGGTWFTVHNSGDSAFVFTMIRNGIAAACVALVDSAGKVRVIIPLSDNARQITGELPLPVYNFYADRIEQDLRRRGSRGGN
jgi:hypothetical protein